MSAYAFLPIKERYISLIFKPFTRVEFMSGVSIGI